MTVRTAAYCVSRVFVCPVPILGTEERYTEQRPQRARNRNGIPAALNIEPLTTAAQPVCSRQLPSLPACQPASVFSDWPASHRSLSPCPSERPPSGNRCGYTKVAKSPLRGCRGRARNCRRSVSGLPRAFFIHCLSSLCLPCVRQKEHSHYSLRTVTAVPDAQR